MLAGKMAVRYGGSSVTLSQNECGRFKLEVEDQVRGVCHSKVFEAICCSWTKRQIYAELQPSVQHGSLQHWGTSSTLRRLPRITKQARIPAPGQFSSEFAVV